MGKTYMTAAALCEAARAMVGKYTYAQVDCIRVITNPMTAAGAKFPYIGSNYLARYGVKNLQRLTSSSQLGAGKALFRSREPTEAGYDLPDRYKEGGSCYTGTLLDFHHVGLDVGSGQIVDSNRGGGQDGPAISTKWKAWEWVADIEGVDYSGAKGGETVMNTATVSTGGKGPLNMRQGPAINNKLCARHPALPEGTVVEVLSTQGEWSRIVYDGETGWVKSVYLKDGGIVTEAPEGTGETAQPVEEPISLPRDKAEEVYEWLKTALNK